jgi:L-cysteine S-thiosulfotransferase
VTGRVKISSSAKVILACVVACMATASAQERPARLKPGKDFQSAQTQALQADDGANPGMLWVEEGGKLWSEATGTSAKACAGCHGDAAQSMKGVAARLPVVDAKTGKLANLEARIQACRTDRQGAAPLAYESQDLLRLTAYISFQSRGLPRSVAIDGPTRPFFEQGRIFWETRQGQMNLACSQCHDDNVGRKLRGDTISQGHSHGWPGYRLDWGGVGSLHRRLRACSLGVRAEILDFGAPEYLALELYLAWRGGDLPIESPGVRR